MRLVFNDFSLKQFKKLPKNDQRRIIDKLKFYLNTSDPLKFARPMIHSSLGNYRFRIGDYRVVFDMNSDNILVHKIGHRREVYK